MSPASWAVSCPHFSHLLLQLSVCWVLFRLCLGIKLMALPFQAFFHPTNVWKHLSFLLLFCCVSPYFSVPSYSPPWVHLLSYLPASVTPCWKVNLKSSNLLPFFNCCFCKGSSNKQTIPQTSGTFQEPYTHSQREHVERQDENPASLQKLGIDPKTGTCSHLK